MPWWIGWIEGWFAAWAATTLAAHALQAVAGLLGGCLYGVIATPVVRTPWYERRERKLHLEILGVLIGAALLGFIADHTIPSAFIAGVIGLPVLNVVILRGIPTLVVGVIEWAHDRIAKGGKSQ